MKKITCILIAILLFASCNIQHPSLARKINNIIIAPEHPKELFDLLVFKFGLPISWGYQNFGNFYSGGLSLGNVNLIVTEYDINYFDYGIQGIALEPAYKIEKVKEILDKNEIANDGPNNYFSLWTTLDVFEIMENKAVFFCDVHLDEEDQYKTPGGAMGIEKLSGMVITSDNPAETTEKWKKIISPEIKGENGLWELGNGPSMEIISGGKEDITSLRIKVTSLETARKYLEENDLLGDTSETIIATDTEKTFGIRFEFAE